MVDAYQDITIPFQMSSAEFFREVKARLNEGGVMVVNMNMRSDREGSINEYLSDTIAGVFGHVCTADVGSNTNRELFASDDPLFEERFKSRIPGIQDAALRSMMERVSSRLEPYEGGGLMLTDDKAPVELLGMRTIDDIISEELEYYKEIFRTEGIEGLLRSAV